MRKFTYVLDEVNKPKCCDDLLDWDVGIHGALVERRHIVSRDKVHNISISTIFSGINSQYLHDDDKGKQKPSTYETALTGDIFKELTFKWKTRNHAYIGHQVIKTGLDKKISFDEIIRLVSEIEKIARYGAIELRNFMESIK